MYLIEWCYGVGSELRIKLCTSESELAFWSGLAVSSGAAMLVVTQVGMC